MLKPLKAVKQQELQLSNPIAVLGAGSWGTALAILLAKNGNDVRLWGHLPDHMDRLEEKRVNTKYLPDCPFPPSLNLYSDLSAVLSGVEDVLVVVPSQVFREVLNSVKSCIGDSVRIAWGTKGLDAHQFLSQSVAQVFSQDTPMAAISGPSFAKEVAKGLPAALSLASNNSDFSKDLISRLHNEHFRIYANDDLLGVQLCGALKNVFAIAVGICDGMVMGANARCALITRSLAEMARLNAALGGAPETVMNLAGVGDLVLTCTDDQSRNRRFGLAIGWGETPLDAEIEIGQVVEGVANAKQVFELAKQHAVEMPIIEQVHAILYENVSIEHAMVQLLQRPPGHE